MRLVVIRHLPTAWNLADKLQGRADICIAPLTEAETVRVAENRAKLAAMGPFDKVFCSTLQRTHETARTYGYESFEKNPLLNEFDFGRFEGKSRHEFNAELGEVWINRPETVTLGESIRDLETRVRQFLASCSHYERVLIFSHGCWCRALKAIHETGDICCMNKTVVRNNEVLVFDF